MESAALIGMESALVRLGMEAALIRLGMESTLRVEASLVRLETTARLKSSRLSAGLS